MKIKIELFRPQHLNYLVFISITLYQLEIIQIDLFLSIIHFRFDLEAENDIFSLLSTETNNKR